MGSLSLLGAVMIVRPKPKSGCTPARAAVVALALLRFTACGLDERSLAERTVYASGNGHPEGGAAGAAAELLPVPECSYSTAGESSECASLIANPGFARNIDGWALEPRAVQARWDAQDAAGAKKSGSIIVTNALTGDDEGSSPGGVFQCFTVEPGQHVQYAADIMIPEGQGSGAGGQTYTAYAGLSLFYYNNDNCEIPTVGNVTSQLLEAPGQWQHISGQNEVPLEIHSVAYRLIVVKPHPQDPFDVHFDNVLARVY